MSVCAAKLIYEVDLRPLLFAARMHDFTTHISGIYEGCTTAQMILIPGKSREFAWFRTSCEPLQLNYDLFMQMYSMHEFTTHKSPSFSDL